MSYYDDGNQYYGNYDDYNQYDSYGNQGMSDADYLYQLQFADQNIEQNIYTSELDDKLNKLNWEYLFDTSAPFERDDNGDIIDRYNKNDFIMTPDKIESIKQTPTYNDERLTLFHIYDGYLSSEYGATIIKQII